MKIISKTYPFFFLILFSVLSCTTRHRRVNYDVSYLYHPEKPAVKTKILNQNDRLRIFLSYYNPHEYQNVSIRDFVANYKFMYKITYDHFSSDVLISDSIQLLDEDVSYHEKSFYFSFTIPKINTSSALLLLYKKDLKRNKLEITDIDLDFSKEPTGNNYLLINKKTNTPILDNYLIKNDTVIIKSGVSTQDSLFVYHYDHTFSPALPPMSVFMSTEKETLNMDTSYWIKTDKPLIFELTGLYFIKKDTNTDAGFSFLVKDHKFPILSRAEEMIEPLAYLLNTEEEQKKLLLSVSPKTSLDSFWLKIGGSKDYSRQLIKSFYQKVEYANKVFTSYKEGWKTDRGIIYIIFGKPDQVYKWEDKEEWVYENIQTHIVSFTFIKRPTRFSDDHYELIRNREYEQYWHLTIEKWKSGIITK